MTNSKRNSIIFSIAGLVVTLLVIGAGVVKSYTIREEKDIQHEKAMAELKEEGCMPARESDKDLAVVLEKIIAIEKDVSEIKADVKYLIKLP